MAGIVLALSQWFDVHQAIIRLTGIVFCTATASSLIVRFSRFRRLSAILLVPLAIALPIILAGSIFYIANVPLTSTGVALIIAVLVIIGIYCSHSLLQVPRPIIPKNLTVSLHSLISFGFAASVMAALVNLFSSQTTSAILGPWQATHVSFFILYALATLFIFWNIVQKPESCNLLMFLAHGLLSTTVLLIIFPIGFGFDPFIHQAAEAHIARYGFLEPKTFYYIGHYVLVVFLSKILATGIPIIDRLIVPLGIVCALIPTASLAMRTLWKDLRIAKYCFLMLFALPYPFLSISTPWGFAYGITALIVLSSIIAIREEKSMRWCIAALVCVSLAVHPLAGIPAAFFCVFFFIWPTVTRLKKYVKILSFVALSLFGILAIPAAFVVNATLSSQLAFSFVLPRIAMPTFISFQSRFSLFLDPAYFYLHNLFLILFALGIAGFFILKSYGENQRRLAIAGLVSFFITLTHAFILTAVINFSSLISYERDDYGMRLVSLAFVFLLPHIATTIGYLASRVFSAACPPLTRMAWMIFSVFILLASLYLSYPRNDAFQAFHGYNVSSADIAAVRWINQDAGDERFAVLANQVVSSAAINNFGFGAEQFYYPLPTSSKLYGYYTLMMKTRRQSIVEDVKKFLAVSRVYIVVPSYEPRAPLITQQLRAQASRWISFENDAVTVFAFE